MPFGVKSFLPIAPARPREIQRGGAASNGTNGSGTSRRGGFRRPRRHCQLKSRRAKNFLQSTRGDKRLPHPHARRHNRRACRLATSCRTSGRAKEMDDSDLAASPDDDHVLGPFLGKLPPEILDAVVNHLGWFQTTFAMAGRTCREAVKRVPDTRVVPRSTCTYAARDGHLEVLRWARRNGCPWD